MPLSTIIKAIQGAYTAYEKFVSTTGKYFFPKVSEHIKKYDDPIIKLIITSEELPKYKSDTLSFNEIETIKIMGVYFHKYLLPIKM